MKKTILILIFTISLFSSDYKTIQRATYKKMKTEPKVALVIGNQDYQVDKLQRTISDATKTKEFLESVGFKVIYAENVKSKGAMRKLINQFLATIKRNGVGLFYFSGHGMSAYNQNYLIPTQNESIAEDTDIEDIGMSVNYLLTKLENKKNRLNIVILDACRNSLGRGASTPLLGDNASGVYIAYATAMGSKARDNGFFTSSFIKNASMGGKIEEVFKRVRVEVKKNTEGKQIPFTSSGLEGDFFFVLPKEGSSAMVNIVYNEPKEDNGFIWWLFGGVSIALISLLFLFLKPKLSKPTPSDIKQPQKKREPKVKSKKREIKGIVEINGLLYQNQPFTKQYRWQEAKEYASHLRLGGFDDWRLPTREELRALGNIEFCREYDNEFWEEWYQNHKDEALRNSKGKKYFIKKEFLENMPDDSYFWTSEKKDRDDIWRVGFHSGCDDFSYDYDMNYVMCVRDKERSF